MTHVTNDQEKFADRLREAVQESQQSTARAQRGGWRRRHRRVTMPMSAPVANPARVRYSDELFVDRLRKALD